MQLMNSSDFERALTHWQVNPEQPEGPAFATPPGVCWIRGYDDFPSIAELQVTMFIDHSKKATRNCESATALPALEEQENESNSLADKLALAFKQDAVVGVVVENDLERDGIWRISCDKDWRTGLYRYLLHAEEGNIIFRDTSSEQDIVRNILLAQLIRENFMYDAFSSTPEGSDYSWDYRIVQAACSEELEKQIKDLGYLRGKTSEAWFLCAHVANEILSVAVFVMVKGQLVKQVVFCEPALGTCRNLDPLVMLFWRSKVKDEELMLEP